MMLVQSASCAPGSLWAARDISHVSKGLPGVILETGGTHPHVIPTVQNVSREDRLLQGLLLRARWAEWVISASHECPAQEM